MSRFLGHPFQLLVVAAKTVAIAHLTWTYGYSIGWGSGPSMLPTFLVVNESFVISKRYRRGRGVKVGDVVNYNIPDARREEGVKRVVGMPGDYVLLNSPGASNDNMIQVPKGHCYLVGDNLPWSRDSRDFGPLPLASIKGRVVAKGNLAGFNPFKWFTKMEEGLQPVDRS